MSHVNTCCEKACDAHPCLQFSLLPGHPGYTTFPSIPVVRCDRSLRVGHGIAREVIYLVSYILLYSLPPCPSNLCCEGEIVLFVRAVNYPDMHWYLLNSQLKLTALWSNLSAPLSHTGQARCF